MSSVNRGLPRPHPATAQQPRSTRKTLFRAHKTSLCYPCNPWPYPWRDSGVKRCTIEEMSHCRIALANLPFPESPDASVRQAVDAVAEAGQRGVDLSLLSGMLRAGISSAKQARASARCGLPRTRVVGCRIRGRPGECRRHPRHRAHRRRTADDQRRSSSIATARAPAFRTRSRSIHRKRARIALERAARSIAAAI